MMFPEHIQEMKEALLETDRSNPLYGHLQECIAFLSGRREYESFSPSNLNVSVGSLQIKAEAAESGRPVIAHECNIFRDGIREDRCSEFVLKIKAGHIVKCQMTLGINKRMPDSVQSNEHEVSHAS